MNIPKLIAAALEARKTAYAPYSHFYVGAALLCTNGEMITGCNIENSSYSATNCAERTALFTAVHAGQRDFTAIAIVGGFGEEPKEYCVPCGICRQVLSEFCLPQDFKVIFAISPTRYEVHTLAELLPYVGKAEGDLSSAFLSH